MGTIIFLLALMAVMIAGILICSIAALVRLHEACRDLDGSVTGTEFPRHWVDL